MTFYQELQLNQAGSKNLLKKSETTKEKMYHILVYLISKCGFGNPHWTIYDAFGYVFCNNGRMSAFCKSAFTGTGNAVKYCCTGSVDIFWMS